jgi:hypothetical protein
MKVNRWSLSSHGAELNHRTAVDDHPSVSVSGGNSDW